MKSHPCELHRLVSSTLRSLVLCFCLVVLGSTSFAAVDYAVFSVSMNKNRVAPGDSIIATIVMKNVGTTASTRNSVTDVRFLSQSSRPLPIDGKVGQFDVTPLAANQSKEVQIAFYVPSVPDGTYYIWAIGDNTSTLGQSSSALDNDYGRGAAITVARAKTTPTTPTTTAPTTTTPTTTSPTTSIPATNTPTTNPANNGSTNTTTPSNPGGTTPTANSTTSTIILSANSSSFVWTTSVYSFTPNMARSGAIDEKIRLGGWGDTYQGYLKFELTGITAPVQSAKFRIYILPDENQTTPVRIMRITSAWSPSTAVAWANQPSMVELTQIAAPSWQSWVEIDVTTLVNGWIRGDFPNYGIAFLPTRTDRAFTTFASPGHADATKRPQLVVVANTPATTPATNPPVSTIPQPNFSSRFYTTENIFWLGGFAPKSTNPPNPQLGNSLGNCTWYSHGRGREQGYDTGQLNAMSGDGGTWDDRARAAGIRVDTTPAVGAIAQHKGQNHVAWVESVNPDGTITVSESSYVTDLTSAWNVLWRTRTVPPSSFTAFIHITKAAATTTTSPATTGTSATTSTNPTTATTNPATNTGGTTSSTPANNNSAGGTTSGTTNPNTGNTGSTSGGTSPSSAVITTTLGTQAVAAPSSKIISISTLSVTPLISGFNISGDTPKKLVVRAVGPTLAQFNVSGVLADPQVRVFDSSSREVAQNDDWSGSTELRSAFTAVGLFGLPTGSKDAAMLVTLPPGVYTAQVATKGGATGLAILEIYEVP